MLPGSFCASAQKGTKNLVACMRLLSVPGFVDTVTLPFAMVLRLGKRPPPEGGMEAWGTLLGWSLKKIGGGRLRFTESGKKSTKGRTSLILESLYLLLVGRKFGHAESRHKASGAGDPSTG
jgi:hypothetical protein